MKKTEKRRTGDKGERRTAFYLRLRGWRILERNYTFGHKEVDIIARRGRVIAFVEVKTRSDNASVSAKNAVTHEKMHNIITAAKGYCMTHDASGCTVRFDVSEVSTSGRINYIPSAYQGE